MYNQKYKRPLQTIEDGPTTGKTGFHRVKSLSLSFSLSLPLLFKLIPWNAEAHRVYLFALASKTHTRGSPRQGTLHYSRGRWWPT